MPTEQSSLRLSRLLEEALTFVDYHPGHELSLGYREAIYKTMGPLVRSGVELPWMYSPPRELVEQLFAECCNFYHTAVDVNEALPGFESDYENSPLILSPPGWSPGDPLPRCLEPDGSHARQNEWNQRGLTRRAALSRAAAEYILPGWKSMYPQNMLFELAFYTADLVTQSALDRTTVYTVSNFINGRIFPWMDDMEGPDNSLTWCAGVTSVYVLRTTIRDEHSTARPIDLELTEVEWDAGGSDPPFPDTVAAVSAAYSGKGFAPLASLADKEKELQFWHWWLEEAVPAAWKTVLDDGPKV